MKKTFKNSFINSLDSKSKEEFNKTAAEALIDLLDERLDKKAEQIYRLIEQELLEKIAKIRK